MAFDDDTNNENGDDNDDDHGNDSADQYTSLLKDKPAHRMLVD